MDGGLGNDREIAHEFAAPAEVAGDRDVLQLGLGPADRILGMRQQGGGTVQMEATFSAFCHGEVCSILVLSDAPSPLAFLMRSSLAAASSSASDVMPRSL
jgi:hypothetical protein